MLKNKPNFKFIGKSTIIEGGSVHESTYSEKKTEFYKKLFKEGFIKSLMPYSVDKKSYAIIVPNAKGIQYYAGVISEETISSYESLDIESGTYFVSRSKSGLSRLQFDQLENNYFFHKINHDTTYNNQPILEVLINGNPMDAEVELWIPIK